MARSYGTATLTLTVTEAITLNSKDEGQTHTHTVASVSDIYRRTLTASTTDTSVVTFASVFGVGQFVVGDVKYMRLTNLDDTNHVVFTLTNENNDEVAIKVDKGQSFIVCPDLSGGLADIFDANYKAVEFSDATCDTSSGAYTVTCDASAQIKVGQGISGTGVDTGATVASVNTPGAVTSFTMSAVGTGSHTNTTISFTPILSDLTKITAKAGTGSVDVELYMALT
tara:strand:+ start:533 stop:1210 length:678 start_codon:yes stop_codon:yes gene_type:complete